MGTESYSRRKKTKLYEKVAQMLERFQNDIANVLMINTGKTYPSALLEVNASIERLSETFTTSL
jgi:glyceraldehyde-3-phosphate dehydrogenase [NAD(P)+]